MFQSCSLQIHGYTERYDSRATYSSPSVPGLMMAVGSVSDTLKPYAESDTFLSRDAGFTWEEVHKDAHLWEFGDSGSIIVIANDEEPTDRVFYTIDEGLTWREYIFAGPGQDKVRVKSIVDVPEDTSRRFIIFGYYPRSVASAVAIQLDFSSLTRRQCEITHRNLLFSFSNMRLQASWIPIILTMTTSTSGAQRKRGQSNVSLVGRYVPFVKPRRPFQ